MPGAKQYHPTPLEIIQPVFFIFNRQVKCPGINPDESIEEIYKEF
jgi:hypothetical protein